MALTVKLPKLVRIRNHRLAGVHLLMVSGLLILLVYVLFIESHSYAWTIPMTTSLEIYWNESATIQGMESFSETYPEAAASCKRFMASGTHGVSHRWGQIWTRKLSCSMLCELDDVLLHKHWETPATGVASVDERRVCWSSFKSFGLYQQYTPLQFMENRGRRDIYLITAKNDWIVDHINKTRENRVELVPQGSAGIINFEYRYQFEARPRWFPFLKQDGINLRGSNSNAKTLVVDAKGRPVGDPIPAGEAIALPVVDVFKWAERADGRVLEDLEVNDATVSGAEIAIETSCFGTDQDVNIHLRDKGPGYSGKTVFHATLEQPVCVLRFKVESNHYQVQRAYSAPYASIGDYGVEVVSETAGFYFKVVGGAGSSSVWDMHTMLLNLASMMVLLSLPTTITSIIAARLLGPISDMYKRTIIEPYDLEEQTAGMATVLAANVSTFHKLSTKTPDGLELIKLDTVMSLMAKGLEARAHVLDEREMASLSYFLYDRIYTRDEKQNLDGPASWCPDIPFAFSCFISKRGDPNPEKPDGITLDQWNQVRLDCEKITFDAVVSLFDKDRKRHCLEKFFTPHGIREALLAAMTHEERADFERATIINAGNAVFGATTTRVGSALDFVGLGSSSMSNRSGTASSSSPATPNARAAFASRGSVTKMLDECDPHHVDGSSPKCQLSGFLSNERSNGTIGTIRPAISDGSECDPAKSMAATPKPSLRAPAEGTDVPEPPAAAYAVADDEDGLTSVLPPKEREPGPEPTHGQIETLLEDVERRLSLRLNGIESTVQRLLLQDEKDATLPATLDCIVPVGRGDVSQVEQPPRHRRRRLDQRWARAILESFGPEALPDAASEVSRPSATV